ncbi:MAG: DUF1295 domain-containing protein [Candidatus Korarchaeota archaeon]|nr:DUF1295 domain-containing protein [Candidatus Korarchaeota archaeon]NIU85497.1 DUF1295 domain-containing protein [Candidatus Thorarchaeota archaeon]NIW15614.1 DUF1295 domain-containing protein [Candidatus Thorarchaeota archaeon]NIW53545.1 DUF1295 domain-containing protein [Candidatus Korarchaeota archaeon]
MGKDLLLRVFSTLLAGLFTIGMVYATFLFPEILHALLSSIITSKEIEFLMWMHWTCCGAEGYGILWLIGVIALYLLVALVVAGFVLEKTHWSSYGSFLLYLPTLSYFALIMWEFSGIGILRVLWYPIVYIFPFLNFGYMPYYILRDFSRFIGISMDTVWMALGAIELAFVGSGIFVFLLGTKAWLYGKRGRKDIIDFGVFKYSRHPQYLGFVLWNFGLTLMTGIVPAMRGAYVSTWFPGFISVLLIVCVALFEEQTMVKQYGEEYQTYRKETPFLLPLPSFLAKLVIGPMKLLIGKNRPTKKQEIAYIFFLYLSLYLLTAFLLYTLMHAILWDS